VQCSLGLVCSFFHLLARGGFFWVVVYVVLVLDGSWGFFLYVGFCDFDISLI